MQEEHDAGYTGLLLRQARRLHVPTPPFRLDDGEVVAPWEQGSRAQLVYLSDEGIALVRDAIRTEQRLRHERRAQWAVWLPALTGVIGALTGLLAIYNAGPQ